MLKKIKDWIVNIDNFCDFYVLFIGLGFAIGSLILKENVFAVNLYILLILSVFNKRNHVKSLQRLNDYLEMSKRFLDTCQEERYNLLRKKYEKILTEVEKNAKNKNDNN